MTGLSNIAIERLTRLADKLEGVGPYAEDGPWPRDKFDMGVWSACQTVSCACGTAALYQSGKQQHADSHEDQSSHREIHQRPAIGVSTLIARFAK